MPPAARRDIARREDCERLVHDFYARALTDPVIGWLFVDVAHLDLEQHLPTMASFWETMLLGHRTYAGSAFAVHRRLHALEPLRAEHFDRWLELWTSTVDALFQGDRAELAKAHATRLAAAFHRRLNGAPEPLITPTVGPLPAGPPVDPTGAGR